MNYIYNSLFVLNMQDLYIVTTLFTIFIFIIWESFLGDKKCMHNMINK